MYWINGQLAESVPLSDRSFQYGDGCFTTILTKNGKPDLWPYHLDRMQQTLARLEIEQPDWQLVYQWVTDIAFSKPLAGIKIHISRGLGGRGYSPEGLHQTQVTISRFDYPAHYPDWQQNGVSLAVCKTKLGLNPLLAGMKHNNRLEQVLIKAELNSLDAQDGVVLDIQGHVIETSMANIFWVSGSTLYTPKLTMSGVAGVMRRHIIDIAKDHSISVIEDEFELTDVMTADEIFICNSLLGIAPVTHLANEHQYVVGQITKLIQNGL